MCQPVVNKRGPVRNKSFPSWPHFQDDEIEAVIKVLKSGKVNYWTGEEGHHFEKEFAESIGCSHAVAVANGSVALELALLGIGVDPGDEVVVTPRTFIASVSCAVVCGAKPVFADVDEDSGNITAGSINNVLGPKTKGIICVHLAGWPCDMDSIMELAREKSLWVVEDCAQAHGAHYKGKPVGSFGDAACFSFCQDKIFSTGGEGGMLVTKDRNIFERAWSYKDHGKSYNEVYNKKHPPGFRWLHKGIGTNWRLTEMQSAIGRASLKKLPNFIARRRENAAILTDGFKRYPALRVPSPSQDFYHVYYKYYVYLRPEGLRPGWSRDRVMVTIVAEGVPCFSGSCSEVYLEEGLSAFRPSKRLSSARLLGETSLMFQVHPTLTEDDMQDAVKAMHKVLNVAAK